MVLTKLDRIAQSVVARAQRQGFVVPREIREELTQADMPSARWKDVLDRARPRLSYRKGRYYFVTTMITHARQNHRNLEGVKRAARQLIRRYRALVVGIERRSYHRIHFIQPVKILTDDRRELHFVSQDISLTGVRLIGAYRLQGQRVRMLMPSLDKGGGQWCFTVQMLWSSTVGDKLIENGGIFLEIHEDLPGRVNKT